MRIAVQQEAFDPGAELNLFGEQARGIGASGIGASGIGAMVSFTGLVRDTPAGDLDVMQIEHYPGMTEVALGKIAAQALKRWSLGDVLVIHRYGALKPGDHIMMVATAAPHRRDAFEAADYLMDYLKSRAPFWKKEITRDGAQWVAAKDADEAALKRW